MATITSAASGAANVGATWVGGIVPGPADDVIIAGHTIDFPVDVEYLSLTLNNVASRITVSGGGTREIAISGAAGMHRTALSSGSVCVVTAATALKFRGTVRDTSGNVVQYWFASNGGTIELEPYSGLESDVLAMTDGAAGRCWLYTTIGAGNTLISKGRFALIAGSTGTHNLFTIPNAGTYTIQWAGVVQFGGSSAAKIITAIATGAATINLTGDVENSVSPSTTGILAFGGSGLTATITGNLSSSGSSTAAAALLSVVGGDVEWIGKLCHTAGTNSLTVTVGGGTFRWRNQAATIAFGESFTLYASAGTVDFSDLEVDVGGTFICLFVGTSAYSVGSGVSLVALTLAATIGVNYMPVTITYLESDPPVLPGIENVAAGEVYGYTGIELVGTGLVVSPSTLSTALQTAVVAEGLATSAFVAAGFTALNQSCSRRAVLASSASFEIPDSGTSLWIIELRTFDGDGAPANAVDTPPLTAVGSVSGDLSARLSAWTLAATGLYRATFTVDALDDSQQLRFDSEPELSDGVFPCSFFTAIADSVAQDFTAADRVVLQNLASRASELRLAKLDVGGVLAHSGAADLYKASGFATPADVLAQSTVALNTISPTALARFVAIDTGETESADGSVAKLSGGVAGAESGNALQETLLEVQSTAVGIAASLAGAPINPVGRVASGGRLLVFVGDDWKTISGTQQTIPVNDPAGGLFARLSALGVEKLSFGASRPGAAPGAITGTVVSLTVDNSQAVQRLLIGVELTAAGVGLQPGDNYRYQIQQTQTHGAATHRFVEVTGSLTLEARTV